MKDNFYVWVTGGITATVIFNPLFIEFLNDLLISLGGYSRIDAFGQPTFSLLFFTWFIFGLIWWIIAQFIIEKSSVLGLLIFSWALALLMIVLFPYAIAVLLWALFTFVLFN